MADEGGESKGGKSNRRKRPARKKRGASARRGQILVALAHPERRRILRVLLDCGERRSPAEVARELECPSGRIAYHVRVLLRLGAVELVGKGQVRGAVEHFYETTIEDDPPVEALLEETRAEDEEGE